MLENQVSKGKAVCGEDINDIKQVFPHIPHRDAMLCAKAAKRNKTPYNILRSKWNFLSVVVRSYIRHELTDYNYLLRNGINKEAARQLISPHVERIYLEWKDGDSG